MPLPVLVREREPPLSPTTPVSVTNALTVPLLATLNVGLPVNVTVVKSASAVEPEFKFAPGETVNWFAPMESVPNVSATPAPVAPLPGVMVELPETVVAVENEPPAVTRVSNVPPAS